MKRSKRRISSESEKYYSSLDDLPLYNWLKCLKGEFQYINHEPTDTATELDVERFTALEDEYLKRYELGKEMERYLRIKINLTRFRLTYIQTGDVNLLNQIAIELENLKKADPHRHNNMSTEEVLAILSKFVGNWIDPKNITVAGFRSLLDAYGRTNKKE